MPRLGIPLLHAEDVALTETPFSIAILAGGESRRLGQDKATVTLNGSTLLTCTVHNLAALSDDLLVVLRPEQPIIPGPWRIARDVAEHTGALAALIGGLRASVHDWAFVTGCDMPYIAPLLVRYLAGLREGDQAIVPQCRKGLEPLHAFYHRSALPLLLQAATQGEQRLSKALRSLRCRIVPEESWRPYDREGCSFFNINTPEELAQARRHHAAMPHDG